MRYINLTSDDNTISVMFPLGEYTWSDQTLEGYVTWTYEAVGIASYSAKIGRICHDLGLTTGQNIDLYITDNNGTRASSYFRFWRYDGYYTVTAYVTDTESGTPAIMSNATIYAVDPGYTTYTVSSSSRYVKLCSDALNTSVRNSSIYVAYSRESEETQQVPLWYVFGYDSASHKFICYNLFGITDSTQAAITSPLYVYADPALYGMGDIFDLDAYLTTDPNQQGGTSTTGGGTGSFDGTSDSVSVPGLPTISASDTGFVTLFNPSLSQLKALAQYMWSDAFSLDSFKKIFADPMDCILGLSIVPVAVSEGGAREVTVGNIGTGVSMTVAASQYATVDCGTLDVNEYWGSALDYAPNTKISIYLPYIGTRHIDTDDVMGKSLHVVYHVDILSGSCAAFLASNGTVLYQFEGQCSVPVPVSSNSWSQLYSSILGVATGVITAGVGVSAGVAAGGAAGARSAVTSAAAGVSNTANAVMGAKPTVEHSGSFSGSGGQMSVQTPYLIAELPRQCLPKEYNRYVGYPSNISAKLSSLSGFTTVEEIHLEGVPATSAEIAEIESILRTGVIL